MSYKYKIYWSEEDNAFIAEVPELPGCMVHGNFCEEAIQNIRAAIDLWIDTAKEFNDPIPKPKEDKLIYA